jgi:tryptophan synthase alpha chain
VTQAFASEQKPLRLESELSRSVATGRKLLATYLTAGSVPWWVDGIHAMIDGGADLVEVGIPFSDPMIDGPVIQDASKKALQAGTTFESVTRALSRESFPVPLVAMTYANLIYHRGMARSAGLLAHAGISGSIIADLPLEASESWREEARQAGIANVLLAAPSTTEERLARIASSTAGFLYVVGVMGVTGGQGVLRSKALEVVDKARSHCTLPVLVGVGVREPEDARAMDRADGVIVGSAFVRQMLQGAQPEELSKSVLAFRQALDQGS